MDLSVPMCCNSVPCHFLPACVDLFFVKVTGALDESGCWVHIGSGRHIQTHIGIDRVLYVKTSGECTWMARKPRQPHYQGIRLRRHTSRAKKHETNSWLLWGETARGIQVNLNWVRYGSSFLPIYLPHGEQILWPCPEAVVPQSQAAWIGGTVELNLLAPRTSSEYTLTGNFLNDWQDHLVLDSLQMSADLKRRLSGKAVYCTRMDLSKLREGQFKFKHHARDGFFNAVANVFTRMMTWEYEGENNRTVNVHSIDAGSPLFMSFGRPEPSDEDIVDFLKVALCGEALTSMNAALKRVESVRQSLLQVTCLNPSKQLEDGKFEALLPRALSEILAQCDDVKPCGALYMWMAVLQQKNNWPVEELQPGSRQGLIEVISLWPADMSAPMLANLIPEVAKQAVLEEASSPCHLCRGYRLQAAVQVILHGDISEQEAELLRNFGARQFGMEVDWNVLVLEDVPVERVECALRTALSTAVSSTHVWDAAMKLLDFPNTKAVAQVCAVVAFEEALARCGRSAYINFSFEANHLQGLLEKMGEGVFDNQLHLKLTNIVLQGWKRCFECSWTVRIDELLVVNASVRIISEALTAQPELAPKIKFMHESEFVWLRLAALRCSLHVQASVVEFSCSQ